MKETIYGYFKNQVETHPQAVALEDEKRSLSFAQLDKLVDTIASGFEVASPNLVGVVMNHSVEMIASLLAILKSGGGYVPVEPFFPKDRIKFIIR